MRSFFQCLKGQLPSNFRMAVYIVLMNIMDVVSTTQLLCTKVVVDGVTYVGVEANPMMAYLMSINPYLPWIFKGVMLLTFVPFVVHVANDHKERYLPSSRQLARRCLAAALLFYLALMFWQLYLVGWTALVA